MSDRWTLLITGTDHGLVGAFGNQFPAHPGWYERVNVVRADHHAELVEGYRALRDQIDMNEQHLSESVKQELARADELLGRTSAMEKSK